MFRVLPLACALALAAAACSKGNAEQAFTRKPAAPQAQKPAAPEAPKPVPAELPDVLARVNGDPIAKTEFERAIQNVEARAGQAVPAAERDRIYRGVLDQLIAYRLLVQESQSRKIDIPAAEVDARLAQIKQQFPSEAAFNQSLAQQKMTVEQLRNDAMRDMRVAKMLEQEVSGISVQPTDVNAFYEQNPDKFKQGERVRASHILIRTPEGADATTKEAARAKAADVLKQVQAGKDFAELAKHYSQDPGSAPSGGDLGYFTPGQMVGPFEQAAFALKPGGVSDLVETKFGFHIIKVADKQPSRTLPLDEVRPQIEQFLQNQQRQQKTQAFINSLKTKGKVEVLI